MTIPSYSPSLNGILSIASIASIGNGWSHLIAPDGSGQFVSVNPDGLVSYSTQDDPYSQCIVSPDGQKASFMPLRDGGPMPGASWLNYGLILVPTSGL